MTAASNAPLTETSGRYFIGDLSSVGQSYGLRGWPAMRTADAMETSDETSGSSLRCKSD